MAYRVVTFLVVGLVAAGLGALAACSSMTEARVAEIKLPTLQCDSCVKTISKALKGTEGVQEYAVDLEKKAARVTYNPDRTSVAQIEKVVAKSGYDANSTKADSEAYAKLAKCCKVGGKAHYGTPEDRKE